MKNFIAEFKKIKTRGNVVDMAVGVIVGGAFTAIVNGLSNYVLKPIINWILSIMIGDGALENVFTFLGEPVRDANGSIVLAESIYIDWGSLINAIINFLLIAIVLFTIVKVINKAKENNDRLQKQLKKNKLSKEDKKILKQRGIKLYSRDDIKQYLQEKQDKIKAEEEKAKLEAELKAKQERLENPTVEDLLKDIKTILQKEKNKKGAKSKPKKVENK